MAFFAVPYVVRLSHVGSLDYKPKRHAKKPSHLFKEAVKCLKTWPFRR